jgi:hypothetical protein
MGNISKAIGLAAMLVCNATVVSSLAESSAAGTQQQELRTAVFAVS